MATAEEVMASVNRGEDPELAKLIDNRSSELGITRMDALRQLLGEGE
jgi:hypothetical protein